MASREEVAEAAARLQSFFTETITGKCEVFSKGSACTCHLCDLDKLYQAACPEEQSPFTRIAREVAELVVSKNIAYGDSVSTSRDAMALLFPNGVPPGRYGDMLMLVRIWDKMMRIATDKDAFGESPYRDIIGYALLAVNQQQNRKEGHAPDSR